MLRGFFIFVVAMPNRHPPLQKSYFYSIYHISSQIRFENSTGFSMLMPSIRRA